MSNSRIVSYNLQLSPQLMSKEVPASHGLLRHTSLLPSSLPRLLRSFLSVPPSFFPPSICPSLPPSFLPHYVRPSLLPPSLCPSLPPSFLPHYLRPSLLPHYVRPSLPPSLPPSLSHTLTDSKCTHTLPASFRTCTHSSHSCWLSVPTQISPLKWLLVILMACFWEPLAPTSTMQPPSGSTPCVCGCVCVCVCVCVCGISVNR